MQKSATVRVCWAAAVALLAGAVLVRFLILLSTPASQTAAIVDYLYDDGYYYLTIAANLADHGRSTFDGFTATNGYQPAWLLVLTVLARLVGTSPHRFFVASCALIYALAGLTPVLALLWRKPAERQVALCLAAGLAAVIIQQSLIYLQGLEPILFPALALGMVMLMEQPTLDSRQQLRLSALMAIAFLVRLDALAVYGAACLLLPLLGAASAASPSRGRLGQIAATSVRLSVFVLPAVVAYLAVNRWAFGMAVPVSGRAKDLGGPFFSNWGIWYSYAQVWKPIAFLSAILLALEYLTRRLGRAPQPLFYRSLAIFSTAILAQYLYYAAFSTWLLWTWYLYLLSIDVALIVGRIIYLCSLFQPRRREYLIGVVAAALVGIWVLRSSAQFALASLPPPTQARLAPLWHFGVKPSQAAGTLTQEEANLAMLESFFASKPHTVIAMGDRSGGLAYWGRGKLSIVQTEGLALGAGYIRAREAGEGARYLERFPIQYYVVDREVIPLARGADGKPIFVIADPIQGRVSRSAVPTFCFPAAAIRYQMIYPSWEGISTRMAFDFSERLPCGTRTLAALGAIERGIGLRQFSLPSEYHGKGVSPLVVRLEDHDRHWRGGETPADALGRYVAGVEHGP